MCIVWLHTVPPRRASRSFCATFSVACGGGACVTYFIYLFQAAGTAAAYAVTNGVAPISLKDQPGAM